MDRRLRASVRRDVRCCYDVLVRGGHRTLMDGHTLRYITRRRGWLHLDATFGYSVGVTAG